MDWIELHELVELALTGLETVVNSQPETENAIDNENAIQNEVNEPLEKEDREHVE